MEQHCAKCGQAVVEGSVYCTHCGIRIQNLCQTCNTLNSPDSEYCQRCGAKLRVDSSSPEPAEPATVTLFGQPVEPITTRFSGEPTEQFSPSPIELPVKSLACPRCHNVNESGAAFCFSCGMPLEERSGFTSVENRTGRPAGFWIRLVAYLIDQIILIVPTTIVWLIAVALVDPSFFDEASGAAESSSAATGLAYMIFIPLYLTYYMIAVSVWATTIGKRIVGIYVLRPDGSKAGPGRAFARYWAYFVSSFVFFVGYIMIAFHDEKRGLHDLICDTVVVYKR